MKNIIIFDLDGTLALIEHRRHLVEQSLAFELYWKPDWDAFYEACDKDQPNIPVIKMFQHLASSHSLDKFELIIFSGRSEVVRGKTEQWLKDNEIRPLVLYMRPEKDYTPDDQLKAKWMEEIGGPERVFCVFDDRKKVVDMWRSKGITCFQVAPGNF